MSVFEAAVQYDDYVGSVACDRSDNLSLLDFLVTKDVATKEEHVAGFRIGANCVNQESVDEVSLVVYLSDTPFDEGFDKLRAVEVSVSPQVALSFFKRFDLVATMKGIDISNTEVDGPHNG